MLPREAKTPPKKAKSKRKASSSAKVRLARLQSHSGAQATGELLSERGEALAVRPKVGSL